MAKYVTRAVEVEAVQWQPGVAHEGLVEHAPEIILSASGTHFYLSARFPKGSGPGPFHMPDAWLTVEGYGDSLPFAFWKVKDGEHRPAGPPTEDPLTRKYLEYAKVSELPQSYAVLDKDVIVSAGDWIVTKDGERERLTPEEFAARYEPEASRGAGQRGEGTNG